MADQPKPATTKVLIAEKQQHANIYAALSAFQGELKPMAKSGEVEFPTKSGNGKVKFNYTPLGEIMSTIYPLLAKHGLSVRHEVTQGTTASVEAILTHESYEEKQEMLREILDPKESGHGTPIDGARELLERNYGTVAKNEVRSGPVRISTGGEMKDVGAAITYARRYSLTMVLGISSEDDKDAELLEQSAKNAVQTVFERFKAGIAKAKTPAEVEKQMVVLQKDVKTLEAGKAPALGLNSDQYTELLKAGQDRIDEISSDQTPPAEGGE